MPIALGFPRLRVPAPLTPDLDPSALSVEQTTPLAHTGRTAGFSPVGGTVSGQLPTDTPDDGRLIDTFGRVAHDLRVSLTDRCNLRCGYCMPAEGLDWLPTEQVLTDREVQRLVQLAATRLGITKVRFTGGEPLLRKGLEDIVAAAAQLTSTSGTRLETALTTNGLGLSRRAQALAAAGLGRVNVSLDTLDAARFAAITRRDRLADVLAGIEAAQAAGLTPVKINAVLLRDLNDDEAPDLLRWALQQGHELRFIEAMPLDAQGGWSRASMVTADETLRSLRRHFRLTAETAQKRGAAPAQRFFVHPLEGGARLGTVGVIASVTKAFCSACDRTRLTADGQLRNCLFSQHETDLRTLLRAGADDDTLVRAWQANAWAKTAGHTIDQAGFVQPLRPMSAIGG